MTITTPAAPRTALERLRWALTDAWTITGRDLAHWARQPAPLVVGVGFSVLMVLMFGYLFGGATDAAKGVTDRFRSMPMAPSAVVVGRATADMLSSVLALAALIGCGLLVGWRWRGGTGDALLAVGLLLLLRFAVVWVGVYLGLLARSPETVTAVQTLVWPLGFLSNVFVATATMPGWLGAVAQWNPLSATVSATRELFGNPGVGADGSWIAEHWLAMAVAWPLAIVAVFLPLSVRRYQRLRR